MSIGKFPDELKLGKITQIYKKDNEELLENYRPVSTFPIFGKIFEKVIYDRLYNYFVSQGALYDRQFSAKGSKNLFITTPNPSNLYIYHASVAWNTHDC